MPSESTPLWIRLTPYIFLGILTIFALWGAAFARKFTNSPAFCGQAEGGQAGLDFTTYSGLMAGIDYSPVIRPGDPLGG